MYGGFATKGYLTLEGFLFTNVTLRINLRVGGVAEFRRCYRFQVCLFR